MADHEAPYARVEDGEGDGDGDVGERLDELRREALHELEVALKRRLVEPDRPAQKEAARHDVEAARRARLRRRASATSGASATSTTASSRLTAIISVSAVDRVRRSRSRATTSAGPTPKSLRMLSRLIASDVSAKRPKSSGTRIRASTTVAASRRPWLSRTRGRRPESTGAPCPPSAEGLKPRRESVLRFLAVASDGQCAHPLVRTLGTRSAAAAGSSKDRGECVREAATRRRARRAARARRRPPPPGHRRSATRRSGRARAPASIRTSGKTSHSTVGRTSASISRQQPREVVRLEPSPIVDASVTPSSEASCREGPLHLRLGAAHRDEPRLVELCERAVRDVDSLLFGHPAEVQERAPPRRLRARSSRRPPPERSPDRSCARGRARSRAAALRARGVRSTPTTPPPDAASGGSMSRPTFITRPQPRRRTWPSGISSRRKRSPAIERAGDEQLTEPVDDRQPRAGGRQRGGVRDRKAARDVDEVGSEVREGTLCHGDGRARLARGAESLPPSRPDVRQLSADPVLGLRRGRARM